MTAHAHPIENELLSRELGESHSNKFAELPPLQCNAMQCNRLCSPFFSFAIIAPASALLRLLLGRGRPLIFAPQPLTSCLGITLTATAVL